MAWSLFAGIALAGWIGTLFIRGSGLESSDWVGQEDEDTDDDQSDEEAATEATEENAP